MNKADIRELLAKPVRAMDIFELIQFERMLARQLKCCTADEQTQLLRKHNAAVERLGDYAIFDPLTKLLNRTAYTAVMDGLITGCIQQGMDFVHVVYDVDNFKQINSRYGHDGGDIALKTLTAIVRDACNNPQYKGSRAAILRMEHPVRIGGEEIVWILPNTSQRKGSARRTLSGKKFTRKQQK